MEPVRLLTRSGDFVADVKILPLTPPAEIVRWGMRMFVRQHDGSYVEGIMVEAVQSAGEPVLTTRDAAKQAGAL